VTKYYDLNHYISAGFVLERKSRQRFLDVPSEKGHFDTDLIPKIAISLFAMDIEIWRLKPDEPSDTQPAFLLSISVSAYKYDDR
jgi:hypothetical protein